MLRRRNFIQAGIVTLVGGTLSKGHKEAENNNPSKVLTPTHTVEARSKENPEDIIQFPCLVEIGNTLLIGSIMELKYNEGGNEERIEEYIITKIEDTRYEHIREI